MEIACSEVGLGGLVSDRERRWYGVMELPEDIGREGYGWLMSEFNGRRELGRGI